MRQHTPSPVTERHAFCATCPSPQEVTALLAKLGFRLAFQMEAQDDLKSGERLPALPSQYHYRDALGLKSSTWLGVIPPSKANAIRFMPAASGCMQVRIPRCSIWPRPGFRSPTSSPGAFPARTLPTRRWPE